MTSEIQSEDLLSNEFVQALKAEGDRACAILGASLLDELLQRLFKKTMLQNTPKQIFEGNGPLANFSSRISLAYHLGMISQDEYRELDLIRRIRNDFAHAFDHALSFEKSPIADRARELRIAGMLADFAATHAPKLFGDSMINKLRHDQRHRFEIGVGAVAVFLTVRMDESEHAESPAMVNVARWMFARKQIDTSK